jgi:riboflavin biosynthesis pyrimidine reductase
VILERLLPAPSGSIDSDDREALLELYRPPRTPWLRINLIASVTGSASGSDGTSETLTNPIDRRLLGVIRELADVVIVGAQSVRAEGYQQPKRARLAIVTRSGDLRGHRIENAVEQPPLVICPPAAAALVAESLPDAEVIVVAIEAGEMLSATSIVAALRVRGHNSLVCEGGPRLAAQFVDAGLVDEFCLTTSPRIGGTVLPVLGTVAVSERAVTLTHLLCDESSALYARWSVAAP